MSDDINFELDEAVCICSGTTKRKIIQLIEDGAPHMAKRLLEELANEVTFMK